MSDITSVEITKLEAYLQTTFGNDRIRVNPRPKNKDSVEVTVNGEFIGIIYKDEEDGETSYDFNMAILEVDLPQTAATTH